MDWLTCREMAVKTNTVHMGGTGHRFAWPASPKRTADDTSRLFAPLAASQVNSSAVKTGPESGTEAPNRGQISWIIRFGFDALPQPADMHIHRAGLHSVALPTPIREAARGYKRGQDGS